MKKLLILSLVISGLLFGCDDWVDVNTDPNNPVEVGPELILPVAQHFSAKYMQEYGSPNHLGNLMMYNWSRSAGFSWYTSEFLYQVTSTFYDGLFDYGYRNALSQYSDLDDLGNQYYAYRGISQIMKAYHFQMLVDLYGDVPYTEALARGGIATPVYDDGQEVYDNLIIQLSSGIALLDSAEASTESILPEDDDIMFGGDLTAWKQFANSVKIRILTRESDVKEAAYITAEIAKIAEDGYLMVDATVNPGYVNQEGQQSPFWESFGASVNGAVTLNNDATCASDFIIEYLGTTTADPRLNALFEEPETGHLGVPQGVTVEPSEFGADQVSNIGPGLLIDATQDAMLFTAAETYFNLAELSIKGLYNGDAEALYYDGIMASFGSLGVDQGEAYDTYIAQAIPNVNYGASDPLEAIITQKWLATMGLTAEQSWFDYSRTGFPSDLPISRQAPNPNGDRPVRLLYPASEVGGNPNLPAQSNAFTDKIFWAAQ